MGDVSPFFLKEEENYHVELVQKPFSDHGPIRFCG